MVLLTGEGGCFVQVRSGFETDLAEVCAPRQANVGLLAYSPLAGGSLSGKYINGPAEGSRFTIFPGDCFLLLDISMFAGYREVVHASKSLCIHARTRLVLPVMHA